MFCGNKYVRVCMAALSESVKACGAEALGLLGNMKQQDSLTTADSSKLKATLQVILATAEVSSCSDTVKLFSQTFYPALIKWSCYMVPRGYLLWCCLV